MPGEPGSVNRAHPCDPPTPPTESITTTRREQNQIWAQLTERNLEQYTVPKLQTVARQLNPSRVVEAIREMKVRREARLSSRFVTKLPVGTRMHVIDTQGTAEGGERVCVVRVGEDEAIGWVTARRTRLSARIIRNVFAVGATGSGEVTSTSISASPHRSPYASPPASPQPSHRASNGMLCPSRVALDWVASEGEREAADQTHWPPQDHVPNDDGRSSEGGRRPSAAGDRHAGRNAHSEPIRLSRI